MSVSWDIAALIDAPPNRRRGNRTHRTHRPVTDRGEFAPTGHRAYRFTCTLWSGSMARQSTRIDWRYLIGSPLSRQRSSSAWRALISLAHQAMTSNNSSRAKLSTGSPIHVNGIWDSFFSCSVIQFHAKFLLARFCFVIQVAFWDFVSHLCLLWLFEYRDIRLTL